MKLRVVWLEDTVMTEQLCSIEDGPDGRRVCFVYYFVQPAKTSKLTGADHFPSENKFRQVL